MANFTKLNGYDVEDSTARSSIESLGETVGGLNENVTQLYNMGNYSTDEVNTHQVWIDNKTIYRKVIHTGAVSTENVVVNHGISNIDKIVNIRCIANTITPNNTTIMLPLTDITLDGALNSYANNTYVGITRTNGYDAEITDSYIIIEYTKTLN